MCVVSFLRILQSTDYFRGAEEQEAPPGALGRVARPALRRQLRLRVQHRQEIVPTVAPIAASNSIYIVKSEVAETKMCRDGQQTLTSCTLFQILHLQHTVLFQTKSPMSTFRFVSATTN